MQAHVEPRDRPSASPLRPLVSATTRSVPSPKPHISVTSIGGPTMSPAQASTALSGLLSSPLARGPLIPSSPQSPVSTVVQVSPSPSLKLKSSKADISTSISAGPQSKLPSPFLLKQYGWSEETVDKSEVRLDNDSSRLIYVWKQKDNYDIWSPDHEYVRFKYAMAKPTLPDGKIYSINPDENLSLGQRSTGKPGVCVCAENHPSPKPTS